MTPSFPTRRASDLACKQLDVESTTLLSEVDSVRYSTTLGTNALIERKGPRIGVLVTTGFKSTIPLSRARGYGEGLPESAQRSEEHTSELQSLMRISYAVFCLKKKKSNKTLTEST